MINYKYFSLSPYFVKNFMPSFYRTTRHLSKHYFRSYKQYEFLHKIKKPSSPLLNFDKQLNVYNRIVNYEKTSHGKSQKFRISNFHTSPVRYVHPFILIMLKPVMKLIAVLSGRGFRKWWRDLPPKKRQYFIGELKRNRYKIGITTLILSGLSWIYYESHIEETPITKRKRFMAFSSDQLEKINEFEYQQIMGKLKGHILPSHHPASRRVAKIVRKILDANLDIGEVKKKKWNIAVIENSIENAFVLPSGHVFVFSGMLNLCSNDDQLGTVLAHEISHCLMGHGIENLSYSHLLDMFAILIITAIWAVLPSDMISLLVHWLFQKLMDISLQLPYSRRIETEADEVGLQLAAKACFDVRECSAFWSKMSILNKTFGNIAEIEFLSTHPNHETRSEHLDSIMDKAIDTRKTCGCPSLKGADPRLNVEVVSKLLEANRKHHLRENPKPVFL